MTRRMITLALAAWVMLDVPTVCAREAVAGRSAATNYALHCMGCHSATGAGSEKGGIPDFRNRIGVFANSDAGRTYLLHVPGVISAGLTDEEIAAVMNFIMSKFAGPSQPADYRPFSGAEVTTLRKVRIEDIALARRKIVQHLRETSQDAAAYPWP